MGLRCASPRKWDFAALRKNVQGGELPKMTAYPFCQINPAIFEMFFYSLRHKDLTMFWQNNKVM
jgi:hypothetical protein